MFLAFSLDRFRPFLRPAEMLVALSCSFPASSFDCFRPLDQRKCSLRFRVSFLRYLSTTVSPSHKRLAEMLVTRFPSCDLFRLLAPARTAVPYFLFPFAFLRLTVGRVSELLYAYCRTGCPMPRSDQDAVAAFPLHLVRMYPHTDWPR